MEDCRTTVEKIKDFVIAMQYSHERAYVAIRWLVEEFFIFRQIDIPDCHPDQGRIMAEIAYDYLDRMGDILDQTTKVLDTIS